MNFSRQECWSGLPFPSPRGNWGIEKNYLAQVNTASNSGECYLNSGYQCLLFEKISPEPCWLAEGLSGCSLMFTHSYDFGVYSSPSIRKSFLPLSCIRFPSLRIQFFPSCFLDPVSSSFLVYPLIWGVGYILQYVFENGCMTSELYEALHIWKCHVKCIYVIYITV